MSLTFDLERSVLWVAPNSICRCAFKNPVVIFIQSSHCQRTTHENNMICLIDHDLGTYMTCYRDIIKIPPDLWLWKPIGYTSFFSIVSESEIFWSQIKCMGRYGRWN